MKTTTPVTRTVAHTDSNPRSGLRDLGLRHYTKQVVCMGGINCFAKGENLYSLPRAC